MAKERAYSCSIVLVHIYSADFLTTLNLSFIVKLRCCYISEITALIAGSGKYELPVSDNQIKDTEPIY